jgi:hypothetical protein
VERSCFVFWCYIVINSPHEFHNLANSLHPRIKIELRFSNEQIEFLHVNVSINNGHVKTDLFSKDTDKHMSPQATPILITSGTQLFCFLVLYCNKFSLSKLSTLCSWFSTISFEYPHFHKWFLISFRLI